MDLEIVETIFKCGRPFGLTPTSSKNRNSNHFQKSLSFLTFALYTAGVVTASCISSATFSNFTLMQFVLMVLTVGNLCIYSFYVLIVVMVFDEKRWFVLIDSVKSVKTGPQDKQYCWYLTTLVVSLLTLLLIIIIDCVAALDYLGWVSAIMILPAHFDKYAQYLYTISACLVLKMVLTRYQHHANILAQLVNAPNGLDPKGITEALKSFKQTMLALKRSTEAFNDIFGWTMLCSIFSGAFRIIVYTEASLRHNFNFYVLKWQLLHFIHEIGFSVTLWVLLSLGMSRLKLFQF
jgi:hypothetical protein